MPTDRHEQPAAQGRDNRASATLEAPMTWETFRLEFDDDGTLWQRGREGWREPVCGVCDDPIRWVLDMASFKHEADGFVMCHARCVWTKEAFDTEREAAPDG